MFLTSSSLNCGNGVMAALLYSSYIFTASLSPDATIAGEFLIHFINQASLCLLLTPAKAGPSTRLFNAWQDVQLALNRASPAAASPLGAVATVLAAAFDVSTAVVWAQTKVGNEKIKKVKSVIDFTKFLNPDEKFLILSLLYYYFNVYVCKTGIAMLTIADFDVQKYHLFDCS